MTTVTNHHTQTTNEVLEAALCYSGRGWPGLPIHSAHEGRCSCGKAECHSPAKHPHTVHGLKDATTDEAVIRRWWARWPYANVAIRTGPESGLFVVDIDTKNDGRQTLAKLIEEHGELPPSIEEVTGSGGAHIIFRHPVGKITSRNNISLGVDVKGDNGYIVCAPSRHVCGGVYRWDQGCAPGEIELADAPRWLLDLIAKPATSGDLNRPVPQDGITLLLERAAAYVLKASPAAEGQRNQSAFRLAGHLAAFKSDTGSQLDKSHILNLLRAWNDRNDPPLDISEFQNTVQSAMTNGTPRDPHVVKVQKEKQAGAPAKRDRLPITVTGNLREDSGNAWRAIHRANEPPALFRHGGAPARIEHDDSGTPIIHLVDRDRLRHFLARAADWKKIRHIKGRAVVNEVEPPMSVVRDVMATHDMPLPVLTRIVQTPIFAEDGALQSVPGYQAVSQTFYFPQDGLRIPTVGAPPASNPFRWPCR